MNVFVTFYIVDADHMTMKCFLSDCDVMIEYFNLLDCTVSNFSYKPGSSIKLKVTEQPLILYIQGIVIWLMKNVNF